VVKSVDYRPDAIHVRAEVAKSLAGRLSEFSVVQSEMLDSEATA